MHFTKYHALGNDYIVIAPAEISPGLSRETVRLLCHRNYGIGSDGLLLGPLDSASCDFSLRIFNPDGGEAEKSGNGLRIFARALWDRRLVSDKPFTIETIGGKVTCIVAADGRIVTVEMGRVSFHSRDIPVTGAPREVLNEKITAGDRSFTFCAATIGNPHCVVLMDDPTPQTAKQFGPLIEGDARFPNRTNVQFMKVLDRGSIGIEIWERGAGYTLASGTSSTAAAAVARRLGRCDSEITVHMPGGEIAVKLAEDYSATIQGPVTRVFEGTFAAEALQQKLPAAD